MTGHSNIPPIPGGIDELASTIALVDDRGARANPPRGEDAGATVVLAPPQAEPRADGVPEATLQLGHRGMAGPPEATLMLGGADLAMGGALPPATMVLGERHEEPSATVAMSTNDVMVARARAEASVATTVQLPSAGHPHDAAASGHGGVTVQVSPASHPMGSSSAPAPFVPMAERSMAIPPASNDGPRVERARVGLWMAIGTLVAAVAGVVVGLLLAR